MLFEARAAGEVVTINIVRADLGAASGPTFGVIGSTLTITLNSNVAKLTTAAELVAALNARR